MTGGKSIAESVADILAADHSEGTPVTVRIGELLLRKKNDKKARIAKFERNKRQGSAHRPRPHGNENEERKYKKKALQGVEKLFNIIVLTRSNLRNGEENNN